MSSSRLFPRGGGSTIDPPSGRFTRWLIEQSTPPPLVVVLRVLGSGSLNEFGKGIQLGVQSTHLGTFLFGGHRDIGDAHIHSRGRLTRQRQHLVNGNTGSA